MKFTDKQITDLLTSLGVKDVQRVENDDEADYNNDEILTAIDAARLPVITPKIKDGLHTEILGRESGLLRQHLVKLTGIPMAELKELSNDDAIKTALAFRESKYSTDTKGLREQLETLVSTKDTERETALTAKQKEVDAAIQKYVDRDINEFIESKLSKAPLPQTADKKQVARILRNLLDPEMDLSYDEATRNVIPLEKGTKNTMLNKAKTQMLDWEETLKEKLSPLGLWATDMRDQKPDGGAGDSYKPKHIKKNPNIASDGIDKTRDAFSDALNKKFADAE